MLNPELIRIGETLEGTGSALTSFASLGLEFDQITAERLTDETTDREPGQNALVVTAHVEKQSMKIVQDDVCLELGRKLVAPAVEALFPDSPRTQENWSVYGINRYEAGGSFGAHQDSVGATVLVVTASGVREFDVYKKEEEDDVFKEVESTHVLTPGSVMILDAEWDVGHAVRCIEGPSVTVVLDVPDMIRN